LVMCFFSPRKMRSAVVLSVNIAPQCTKCVRVRSLDYCCDSRLVHRTAPRTFAATLLIVYTKTNNPVPEYAQVLKMLGNGRLEALCFDGEKRLAHIRGKLRKKVWINQGDIILLSLRDYQDEKGDVLLKYSADEARSLKAYGELPESAKINETTDFGEGGEEGGIGFEFDEDRSDSDDKDIDIDDI
jgi:translation initiation factor 1A